MAKRVAIVHDFLREYGGGERVLEVLHEMYPDSPVYVAFLDKKALGNHWQRFQSFNIQQTWFAKLPFVNKLYSPLRFLADKAFASLDLSSFDVVITSSNAFMAKAVKVPNGKQVCYCHTPPRSLYGYSTMSDWKKNPLIACGGKLINHYMRVVDFKVSQEVDIFVANSKEVQFRIKKFYKRDSVVIYPPVTMTAKSEVDSLTINPKEEYYLFVGRLGLQKHPDLVIEASKILGFKLKIVGTGNLLEGLKQQASGNVEFLGAVDDQKLAELYLNTKALIHPAEDEDFGIIPVEAMSLGIPVIAHNSGGTKETVIDGQTGILFENLTLDSLAEAIKRFEKIKLDKQKIIAYAKKFSKEEFKLKMKRLVDSV